MSSVSEPEISPADDSPTCDPPVGHPSARDPHQSFSASTPIHSRYHTTERYGISSFSRGHIHTVLAVNVAPYILGPMPPDAFLDRFLPSRSISIPEGTPSFQAGMFTSLLPPANARGASGAAGETGTAAATDATGASGATRPTPYKALKDGLQTYLPALDICITAWSDEQAKNSRFPLKIRPDCSVYAKEISPNSTNSSLVEFFIEHKSQPHMDPFIVPKSKSSALCLNPFVKDSAEGISTLGQMTSYVTSHLGSQFRTHAFFILIVHNYARIIRWDRGGAVVTAPIRFNEEPYLFDFFLRYNYAKSHIRGSDSSVRAPKTEELRAATCLIDEFHDSGSDQGKAKSFLVVSIPRHGNVNDSDESDCYVIEAPFATIFPPTGRATRTFIAYDIRRNRRVLIKDSWRIDIIGVPKEGDTYAALKAQSVPYIAFCSQSGDIGDDIYHSTQTHLFVDADWAPSPKPGAEFTPHRHYRIVLDTIGTPLEEFKCSRDMVRAIRDSLLAHEAAYHRCGILHRDISPSNILITDGGGLLIDWDLCKNVNSNEHKARRAARTGTWQFMAADLIADPEISQTFVHDLESAFYVMFWLSLKYLPSSYDPSKRGLVLYKVFNPVPVDSPLGAMRSSINLDPLHNRGINCGIDNKVNWMANSDDLSNFEFTGNPTLSKLLSSLKKVLMHRHLSSNTIDGFVGLLPDDTLQKEVREKLSKRRNVEYSQVLKELDDALRKEWPHDDSAQLQKIILPPTLQMDALSGSKRLRTAYFASHNSQPVHSEPSNSKRRKTEELE